MDFYILITSLVVSCTLLIFIANRCQISLKLGLGAGIVIGFLTTVILLVIDALILPLSVYWMIPIEMLCIFIITIITLALRFFRDPERAIVQTQDTVLSPADGTIRYIHEIKKGEMPISIKKKNFIKLVEILGTDIIDQGAYLIGIEMSILDVHVTRSPISGKMVYQNHIRGTFKSLRKQESLLDNERVIAVIDSGEYKIAVVQIASRLVRRIVSYKHEGDTLEAGQRMGMITFGSQVDVVVPNFNSVDISVKKGEHVTAGCTELCKFTV